MPKLLTISIRYLRQSDAKYFLNMFDNPKFYFWKHRPTTLKEEKERIRLQSNLRKEHKERNNIIEQEKKMDKVCCPHA